MQSNHSKIITNRKIRECYLWIKQIINLSEKIIHDLQDGFTETQVNYCNQRDTLIKLFTHSYNEIYHNQKKYFKSHHFFQKWVNDLQSKINQVIDLNHNIIEQLEFDKKITLGQLSDQSQKRKIIQKYNLTNLKQY